MPNRQQPKIDPPQPQESDVQEVLHYHYAKGYLPTENPKHEDIHADGDRNV